ncbi:MAG TPA: hypothetical protein VMF58_06195 [Rhizomicrobium sp.]|nr:hypothetical protein [Rhizomicrobium sp.]
MKLLVTPGYGWGWFQKDGSACDVPPPFDLDTEIIIPGIPFKMVQGRVEGDHPLAGFWIVLTQRHDPADGECNLYAVLEKLVVHSMPAPFSQAREIVGYANARIRD